MEVHVQKCQNCMSQNLKNILFRESGEPDRVYVQCHDCEQFVASYAISPMGYYHHGKGFESFLRGVHRTGDFMSGRRVQQLFLNRKEQEEAAFEDVLEKLRIRDEKRKEKKNSEADSKNND